MTRAAPRKSPRRPPLPLALALAGGLAVAMLLAGCASYTTRMRDLRPAVARGDIEAALARVEKTGQPGDLLYHLERGALLHYDGRFAESNAELEQAAVRLEELYTISLSRRGLTLLLNDEVEAYQGEVHEGNYLHYLRILNFLALGERSAAAVEARRLALRLAMLADTETDRPAARSDPFLHYLCGAVLEGFGEWNGALISYRLAREAWSDPAVACGSRAPAWLSEDLARAATRSGIAPADIGLEAEVAEAGPLAPREGREGDLLLLIESGWAPAKSSEHLRLPIFRTDPDWRGGEGAARGGAALAERVRYRRQHDRWSPAPVEVAYFLDVALPVLAPRDEDAESCRLSLTRIEGAGLEGSPLRLRLDAGEPPIGDLACRVEAQFAGGELGILAKTIGRALLKYFAAHQAEQQGGRLAGILANIAGAATEKADTRGWLMLPARIRAERVRLPAGSYRLEIETSGARGEIVRRERREVEVVADGLEILSSRGFAD